ncbi:MAG TPA: hypothetical protein VNO14_01765 [Blastocatellia bacterium]|nr:hypothetical protein [Blastocatellia bacterium]
MIVAMIMEQGWEWSLFSVMALLYSTLVLAAVIFILAKSVRLEKRRDEMRFPGRVTGERPSERNPG